MMKYYFLIVFTSWEIWQYVYYSYLFPSSWRHKFWIKPKFSNQAVFLHDEKNQDKNLNFARAEKAFKVE